VHRGLTVNDVGLYEDHRVFLDTFWRRQQKV